MRAHARYFRLFLPAPSYADGEKRRRLIVFDLEFYGRRNLFHDPLEALNKRDTYQTYDDTDCRRIIQLIGVDVVDYVERYRERVEITFCEQHRLQVQREHNHGGARDFQARG